VWQVFHPFKVFPKIKFTHRSGLRNMIPAISVVSMYRASFDEIGLSIDPTRKNHAISADSLRSPSIASHLQLIDPRSGNIHSDWVKQLLTQMTEGVTTLEAKKPAGLKAFIIRHRASFYRLGECVAITSIVIGLCLFARLFQLHRQWLSHPDMTVFLEHQKALTALFGFFGFSFFALLPSLFRPEIERRIADPFMNGPHVIDPNIVDPNALNDHPQNAHAASVNREHVKAFQALQALIPNPVDKTLAKNRLLEIFDYLCKDGAEFQKEMIALYPLEEAFDFIKLYEVKKTIESAAHFMTSEAQADRTPMHYPPIVTTSAVLTHVWSCIEQLSIAGYENEARLLTENMHKALYASDGYCNTGHVSRVLQAFKDTLCFGFDQANQNQASQASFTVITPQDFYMFNHNDLNALISEVVNTDSIRAQLHALEPIHHLGEASEDRLAYKEAATQIVKKSFSSQLGDYLASHHDQVLQGNAHLHEGLMRFLEADFAAFIDNARNDDDDINSIASFS